MNLQMMSPFSILIRSNILTDCFFICRAVAILQLEEFLRIVIQSSTYKVTVLSIKIDVGNG